MFYNTLYKISDIDYKIIGLFFLYSFILSFLIGTLSWFIITKKKKKDKEKLSSYECGFMPFDDARGEYYIQFYLVAILFLIFDVELIFVFPWSFSLTYLGDYSFIVMIIFFFILYIGFLYEIAIGALEFK